MDPGVGYANVRTASEARSSGQLVDGDSLSPSQLLGALDKILGLELVLYRGYNMSHTLLTCHYVADVDAILHPSLRLYCNAVLGCVGRVLDLVRAAEVSFEEDYVRVPLEVSTDMQMTFGEMVAKLEQEKNELKTKAAAQDKNTAAVYEALASRFELRRDLLALLEEAVQKAGPHLLGNVITKLEATLKTQGVLKPEDCPASALEPNEVARDLGSASPARAIPSLDGAQIVAEITNLLEDFKAAGGVPINHPTIDDLLSFLMLFGLRRPCLLSRACLRKWLAFADKLINEDSSQVVQLMMRQYKCPKKYLDHPLTVKQNLIGAEGVLLYHLLLYMCLNPARQRRRLRTLMREAPSMTQCCLEVDRSVATEMERRKFFQFFTAFQVIVNSFIALQHLRLGSLLQLYETDEVESIYWYVNYLHSELDVWKEYLDLAKVKTDEKKGGKNAKQQGGVSLKKVKIISYHDSIRHAEAALARCIYFAFLGLQAKRIYTAPVYELQTGAQRWIQRFSFLAFRSVVPVPKMYEDYVAQKIADLKQGAAGLINSAIEACREAKTRVEAAMKSRGDAVTPAESAYWKSLVKVAVINTITLQSLSESSYGVTLEWSHNPLFPAIKVGKK